MDNRRGQREVMATPALALRAMLEAAGNRPSDVDAAWADGLRRKHRERMAASSAAREAAGADGKIHPRVIFDTIAQVADPDHIAIADGGALLSFARVGLASRTYMAAAAFGCLGVGVPFAVAAPPALP